MQKSLAASIIIFCLVFLSLIAYFSVSNLQEDKKGKIPDTANIQMTNFCNQIQNAKFQSVIKYESGLSANGLAAKDYETITFKENKFRWNHSDTPETGTYTCDGNTIEVKFSEFARTMKVHFDTNTQILSWEDHDFQKIQ